MSNLSRVCINVKDDLELQRSCVFIPRSVGDFDSTLISLIKSGNVSYAPILMCHVTSGARHNKPIACYVLAIVERMPSNEEGCVVRLTYERVDHNIRPASLLGFDDISPSYAVDSVYMIGDQVYSKVHEIVLRRERWMHHEALRLLSVYDVYPALIQPPCHEDEGVDLSDAMVWL